jgi:hypothetical protein
LNWKEQTTPRTKEMIIGVKLKLGNLT